MGYDLKWSDGDQHGYFRVNHWRMPALLEHMGERGMLIETQEELRDWQPIEHGLPGSAHSRGGDGHTCCVETWEKIPTHKLMTNNGYRVTPAEIRGSLDALAAWVAPGQWQVRMHKVVSALEVDGLGATRLLLEDEPLIPPEYWHAWLKFLAEAADHGGFWVY